MPKKLEPMTEPGSQVERPAAGSTPSPVEQRIHTLGGWRAEVLAAVRQLILAADPAIEESCKWIKPVNPLGVPVWSHAGIVCTGEAYKQTVKLTFAKGASLTDPHRLFNASLDGNARRAIDIREGEVLDSAAFTALFQQAVVLNLQSGAAKAPARKRS